MIDKSKGNSGLAKIYHRLISQRKEKNLPQIEFQSTANKALKKDANFTGKRRPDVAYNVDDFFSARNTTFAKKGLCFACIMRVRFAVFYARPKQGSTAMLEFCKSMH